MWKHCKNAVERLYKHGVNTVTVYKHCINTVTVLILCQHCTYKHNENTVYTLWKHCIKNPLVPLGEELRARIPSCRAVLFFYSMLTGVVSQR